MILSNRSSVQEKEGDQQPSELPIPLLLRVTQYAFLPLLPQGKSSHSRLSTIVRRYVTVHKF